MAQSPSHSRPEILEPPRRILVVDDNPALLIALSDMLKLRLRQLEVDTVDSGQAALQRLAQARYDLVITDLKMPGMDGLALTREIRARCPGFPVLMLTGAGDTAHAAAAIRAGAYGFIDKPVQRDSFVRLVTQALQRRANSPVTKRLTVQEWSERLNHCQEAWHKAFSEHRKLLLLRANVIGDEPNVESWLVLAERHARLVQDQIALTKQIIGWYRTRLERREEGSRLKSHSKAVLREARHILQLTKAGTV